MHASASSEIENDCKKSILESFAYEAEQTFPDRLKIYESKTANLLKTEEEFTHKMIDSYINLNTTSDKDYKSVEFSNLWKINQEFLSYLNREEKRSSPKLPMADIQMLKGLDTTYNVDSGTVSHSGNDIFAASLYEGLYLELKNYETKRLRDLGAKISENEFKISKFTEHESANLLRGVHKHGENNWRAILKEEAFDKSRTVNQLVLKWRMIKIFMKGELRALNLSRQKLINSNDWIIATIKALEKKWNISRELPVNTSHSFGSPLLRNADRLSDDSVSILGSAKEHNIHHSGSFNPNPLFLIEKFEPKNMDDNCSNELDDKEDEGEGEEGEPIDYFANIVFQKRESTAHKPPQNYIKPKNRKLFKSAGNMSFKKSKQNEKQEDEYNISIY